MSLSSIFFVNVPIGVLAIVASLLLIESKDTSTTSGSTLGLLSSALGLFALTYALIEANNYGWTSGRILGAFACRSGCARLVRRTGAARAPPMLELALFRNPTFTGANPSSSSSPSRSSASSSSSRSICRTSLRTPPSGPVPPSFR